MKQWKELLLSPDDTVQCALELLDKAGSQFAMVLDEYGRLLGVLTDGNIRRGLLNQIGLGQVVRCVMEKDAITVSPEVRAEKALAIMEEKGILYLPVVDERGRVLSLWSYRFFHGHTPLDTPVVLMAGGRGVRLGELTKNCPKPMLTVGSKPILEHTVFTLHSQGFRNFYITLNYRGQMIEDHFGDGSKFGISITYLKENKPLGTAGALSMLPNDLGSSFIVMNGDILTRCNFRLLSAQHAVSGAAATMVTKLHQVQIPYGVVNSSKDGSLCSVDEKPMLSYAVSAGINVFSPSALPFVPKDTFFDAPQLVMAIKNADLPVKVYPIDDYWLDIGRVDDYRKANSEFDVYFEN